MSLILIVEDNPMNAKLARDILEAKGYSTVTADSGEDGVRLAAEKRPDLILMDIQLPGIDGIEAFKRVRQNPLAASIPVIAFTASVTSDDRNRVTEAGFDAFVSKPIDLKAFVATVQGLVPSDRA
jgi:two-component system, cell cycle response regulator DivK